MTTDLLVQNLIFWPGVVLAIHFLYIRKSCHPDWNPWLATLCFILSMILPLTLAMGLVVVLIDVVGLRGVFINLLPIAALLALVPGMIWAQKLITNPPRYKGADKP